MNYYALRCIIIQYVRSVNVVSLKGRDFLTLKDFTGQEIMDMVQLGIRPKGKTESRYSDPYFGR